MRPYYIAAAALTAWSLLVGYELITRQQHVPYLKESGSDGISGGDGDWQVIAYGSTTLAPKAVASGSCTEPIISSATGALQEDTLMVQFASDPTSVVGYEPSSIGMLTVISYPITDAAVFKVCNNTLQNIAPGPVVMDWEVRGQRR